MGDGQPRQRDRVHRRGLPGESRPRGLGVGGARRPVCEWGRSGHDQPAHGDRGGARGVAVLDGAACLSYRGGERFDLCRELFQGPLVAGLAAEELAQLGEQAGGQPGPVGAADRAGAGFGGHRHLPVGQGALGRASWWSEVRRHRRTAARSGGPTAVQGPASEPAGDSEPESNRRNRRTATADQITSTTPNGHAPDKKP